MIFTSWFFLILGLCVWCSGLPNLNAWRLSGGTLIMLLGARILISTLHP